LFIGDASYLFVPDNEHYEQSDLLWFDEHNHPVKAEEVDLSDKRYQQHRCYKLVSVIHVNRKLDFFFVVAARVVAGRRHECSILYELVEEVVRAVPKGFIKVLIVDRGLIDGERMGHLKQNLAVVTIVPLRTNMDLYADAIGLTRVAWLRLGALCAAGAAVTPLYRASQAAPCSEAGSQAPADFGGAQDQGCGFRFVRCGAARVGAARASDPARSRSRSAELEPVPGAVNGGGKS
jgi:hypothetical protein